MKRTSEQLKHLKVVSNASPLIYLSRIGRLNLLHDLLLLDDLGARVFAKTPGFKILGTIGLILQAYNIELISFAEFEECHDDLEHYDFWLHPHLKRRIMTEAELIKQRREHVD